MREKYVLLAQYYDEIIGGIMYDGRKKKIMLGGKIGEREKLTNTAERIDVVISVNLGINSEYIAIEKHGRIKHTWTNIRAFEWGIIKSYMKDNWVVQKVKSFRRLVT